MNLLDTVARPEGLAGHGGARPCLARVSGARLLLAGEEGEGVREGGWLGHLPGVHGVEERRRGGLRGGHGVDLGMPGTQLCAWLPGEDDNPCGGWA